MAMNRPCLVAQPNVAKRMSMELDLAIFRTAGATTWIGLLLLIYKG